MQYCCNIMICYSKMCQPGIPTRVDYSCHCVDSYLLTA